MFHGVSDTVFTAQMYVLELSTHTRAGRLEGSGLPNRVHGTIEVRFLSPCFCSTTLTHPDAVDLSKEKRAHGPTI